MTITVSTDGSALGNPNGPMGWAWADHAANAARTDGHQHDGDSDAGGATNGTNQIGELCAVLEALRAHRGAEPLTIETDSQYAINCSTTWVKGWKKNGWKNSQKKPVKNAPLIKAIDAEIGRREGPVKFVWVKGHNGNPGNEKVDDLAHTYSGDARSGVKDGYLPLEGWQSLLASPYAKGVDIPADAKMLIDGKITEEQYHLGRGVEPDNDNDDDFEDDGNAANQTNVPMSHKPTLTERLAEPEGVPEYDFSPRKSIVAHHRAVENDESSEVNNQGDVNEVKAHGIGRTVRSQPDFSASPVGDDVTVDKSDAAATETELPVADNKPDTLDKSDQANKPSKNDDNSDFVDDDDKIDNADISGDESDDTDANINESNEADNGDTHETATDVDATQHTEPEPKTNQAPSYLTSGLSVNGTLHFVPAPQTSPTYNGRPRHIRGVIAIDGYVAGDGTILLNNAPFLIANNNHKK
ncbi:ribonuclease HI [Bifidobacterium sp. ESL0690]|uniref:ribonuclease H family protein n=1 Tax=Bifidobacterium sp. ESL0690 TaxID=2983214 RepID=UPI0023F9FDAB|nr:ribonuclease H [Bifidobacterium sp. ESL0690]WEV47202.1 ribonuclease HI [Bifidobacterium sp. ESL0690]